MVSLMERALNKQFQHIAGLDLFLEPPRLRRLSQFNLDPMNAQKPLSTFPHFRTLTSLYLTQRNRRF